MNYLKAVLSFLIVAGLNQNLFLTLGDSLQKETPKPMSAACACDPSACMCPPSNGCEHNKEKRSELKIKAPPCHSSQKVISITVGRDVPTLTTHSDDFTPYIIISYLDRLPADKVLQQYLTPPERPPQTSLV